MDFFTLPVLVSSAVEVICIETFMTVGNVCRHVRVNTSTGHTSVDIGASANLKLVDKFCYLSDMLSVDGDAAAAVEARV